jgi:hypothetical protein
MAYWHVCDIILLCILLKLKQTVLIGTALEIAGVPPPSDRPIDGASLMPILIGKVLWMCDEAVHILWMHAWQLIDCLDSGTYQGSSVSLERKQTDGSKIWGLQGSLLH